jgi:hypothetical protein
MGVTPVGVPDGVGPANVVINPPANSPDPANYPPPANNPGPGGGGGPAPGARGPTGKTLDGANRNESMWGMYQDTWENTHPDYRPTWTEFQRDFRNLNKQVGDNGYLNASDWYDVPTYGPGRAPTPPQGSGPAVIPQTGGVPQQWQPSVPPPPPGTGPGFSPQTGGTPESYAPMPGGRAPGQTGGPAVVPPTGAADGSSPANAIRLDGWQTVDQVVQGAKPQSIVLAVRGQLSVQDLPGWRETPGLQHLGADQSITYLGALLVPVDFSVDGKGPPFAVRFQDSTLFLSLHIPGVTTPTNPVVMTLELSDFQTEDMEAGLAANTPFPNRKWLGGRDLVVFTNARTDVSPDIPGVADHSTVSGNFGVLISSEGMKKTTKFVKKGVKGATRTAQFAQAVSAAVSAAPTGGRSVPQAAASIVASEVLRGAIDNSLDGATFYWGLAWRGEVNFQAETGQITINAQKGAFAGKWVTFNLGDIPSAAMDALAPDSINLNEEWLVSTGMNRDQAKAMAGGFGLDPKPLLDQTAAYLGITTDELISWFNQQDKDWVASFAHNRMRFMSHDENEVYPVQLKDGDGNVIQSRTQERWKPETIEDLVWCAQQDGHPMPRGS